MDITNTIRIAGHCYYLNSNQNRLYIMIKNSSFLNGLRKGWISF